MPGEVIDQAWVEILPKIDRFLPDLRRQLDRSLGAVEGQVRRTGNEIERSIGRGSRSAGVEMRQAGNTGERAFQKVGHAAAVAGRETAHVTAGIARGLGKAAAVIGATAVIAGTVAVRGILKATTAASDLTETINKSNVIFKGNEQTILKWSRNSSTAFGLSRQEALSNAAAFGDMFQQLGAGVRPASQMSTRMVELAADFASFSNADITQVLEAQQAAFRGEYDSLQRFVPGIKAARVEQEALKATHKKSVKDLTDLEKAQAVYNIMLHDSVRAQGDFAKTSDQLANSQRIAKAQWIDLQAAVGKAFLPAQLAVVSVFSEKLLPAFNKLAVQYGPAVEATISRIANRFADSVPSANMLVLGVEALGAAFSGEGITTSSDKFVGKMERVGVAARFVVDAGTKLKEGIKAAVAGFKEGEATGTGFLGTMSKLGVTIHEVITSFKEGAKGAREQKVELADLSDVVTVGGAVLKILADNLGFVVRNLPLIAAGFVVYKGAQAAANIATTAHTFLLPVQIAGQFALARANKAVATSQLEVAATARAGNVAAGIQTATTNASLIARGREAVATKLSSAAEAVKTGVTNLGVVATVRNTAATIASRVAMVATSIATKAWAAAQVILNLVLTANPIGIVIVAIAALVAGIIIAYKHSETFRKIVQGAWEGIKVATGVLVRAVLTGFQFMLNVWLTVAGGIIKGAAAAFGWVPGIGPKLKGAAKQFDTFKDQVNGAINKLKDKTVTVTANARINTRELKAGLQAIRSGNPGAMREGGLLRGPGGPRDDLIPIMASNREFMQPADAVDYYGVPFMEDIRHKRLPRYATGGVIVRPRTNGVEAIAKEAASSQRAFEQAVSTGVRVQMQRTVDKAIARAMTQGVAGIKNFIRSTDSHPYVWGGAGPGGYDCSGLTGEVYNRIKKLTSYRRRFTTSSNFGALGFHSGLGGVYSIGVTPGQHMAGMYGGLKFEARSTRSGIIIGSAARSPSSFPRRYHLAGGGLITIHDLPPGVDIGGDPGGTRIAVGRRLRARDPGDVQVFDRGGTLLPGLNLVANRTGRPEPVVPAGGGGNDVILNFSPGSIIVSGAGLAPERVAQMVGQQIVQAFRAYHEVQRKGART